MRDPKEARNMGSMAEVRTGAEAAALSTGAGVAKMEFCHGSVCLGNQKPTHCICPTDKK